MTALGYNRHMTTTPNATKVTPGSVIHATRPTILPGGYHVLACTGRAVRGYVGTADKVTCKSCLKNIPTGRRGAF